MMKQFIKIILCAILLILGTPILSAQSAEIEKDTSKPKKEIPNAGADVKQKADAEAETKRKADAKQKADAEAETKRKADVKQKADAEAETKRKADVKQKADAETKRKADAEQKADALKEDFSTTKKSLQEIRTSTDSIELLIEHIETLLNNNLTNEKIVSIEEMIINMDNLGRKITSSKISLPENLITSEEEELTFSKVWHQFKLPIIIVGSVIILIVLGLIIGMLRLIKKNKKIPTKRPTPTNSEQGTETTIKRKLSEVEKELKDNKADNKAKAEEITLLSAENARFKVETSSNRKATEDTRIPVIKTIIPKKSKKRENQKTSNSSTKITKYGQRIDGQNGFLTKGLKDIISDRTIYKLSINGNKGTFEISSNQDAQRRAILSERVVLNPACLYNNLPDQGNRIKTLELGIIELKGDEWTITQKAKIQFL